MRGIIVTFDADGHVIVKKPNERIEMTPNEAREEANDYTGEIRAKFIDSASTADRLYEEWHPYT